MGCLFSSAAVVEPLPNNKLVVQQPTAPPAEPPPPAPKPAIKKKEVPLTEDEKMLQKLKDALKDRKLKLKNSKKAIAVAARKKAVR